MIIDPVGGVVSEGEKAAMTFFDVSMERVQVDAFPEQSPDQPVKVNP
jgi:hypothetical protein